MNKAKPRWWLLIVGALFIILQFVSMSNGIKYGNVPWLQPEFMSDGKIGYSLSVLLGYLLFGIIGIILIIIFLVQYRKNNATPSASAPSAPSPEAEDRSGEDREYIYAEAANGLTVRIPADRYPQWKQAQEEIKAGKRTADPEKVARLSALIRGEAPPPLSEGSPPPAPPPPFESSLDLLSQLRDECEQEQAQKEPQTVIVRRGPPKWVTVLLVCLCVVSLTGCGVLGYFLKSIDAELQMMSTDYERVKGELQSKKRDYSLLQADYLDLVEENSEDAVQRLRNAIDLASYMVRVGFIVDGSSYYHTVNCPVMRNASEYQARNREYCERLGYKSCPDCH